MGPAVKRVLRVIRSSRSHLFKNSAYPNQKDAIAPIITTTDAA
jgi:hypothetical protein